MDDFDPDKLDIEALNEIMEDKNASVKHHGEGRCKACNLRQDQWQFRPYCLAKTTHSDLFDSNNSIFDKQKMKPPFMCCASCGLPEDNFWMRPNCPTSRWSEGWQPPRSIFDI